MAVALGLPATALVPDEVTMNGAADIHTGADGRIVIGPLEYADRENEGLINLGNAVQRQVRPLGGGEH